MKEKISSLFHVFRTKKWLALTCAVVVLAGTTLTGIAFAAPNNKVPQYIGEEKAKTIALTDAGVSENEAIFVKTHLDHGDGWVVYDVEFYSGNTEYDYEIDATGGAIVESDREIEAYSIPRPVTEKKKTEQQTEQQTTSNNNTQYIGEAKAKAVSLEHAGVSEARATFIKAKLDYDDARVVYDVEFYSDNTEYDYEIDAFSGTVLKHDREIESYCIPQATAQAEVKKNETPAKGASTQKTTAYIGNHKAKSIALSAAGLSEAQVRKIKVELDREYGTTVYEVGFESGRMEYSYDINATTGAVLYSDVEYDD